MTYRLHAGTVPDGQHPHRVLFNTDHFYRLRDAPAWHEVLKDADGNALGDMTFHTDLRVSGWSAPFGGPDWSREYWRPEQIHQAVGGMGFGTSRAMIRAKPQSFGENEAATLQALLQYGWTIEQAELNYSIPVPATLDEYERTLSRQAVAAIDRGEEQCLACWDVPVESERTWAQCYEVLKANREEKGRPISLDLGYVRAIRDAFPGLVRMMACSGVEGSARPGEIVAAALVYRVARARDVVQFWGDHAPWLRWSPMNLLVREVVEDAIRTGAKVLDLGISTEDGAPNGGLCRFKRSVGARAEPRFVLGR